MAGMLLWLLVLAVAALAAAVFLRRTARLAGGTHELERLQSDVAGINQRLAAVVDPLVSQLDEVRRGARDPAEMRTDVDEARATLRTLSREAHAIKGPSALADRVEQLVWEVDRAARAADMAGHGLGQVGKRRHEADIEAQVALKRGTLGLRHAREAVMRIMVSVAKLTPAEVNAMPRSSGRPGTIVTPPVDEDLLLGSEEPPAG